MTRLVLRSTLCPSDAWLSGQFRRSADPVTVVLMKGGPGFVGAYVVAVDDTHGVSNEVFETEKQARAAAPPEGATAPG